MLLYINILYFWSINFTELDDKSMDLSPKYKMGKGLVSAKHT